MSTADDQTPPSTTAPHALQPDASWEAVLAYWTDHRQQLRQSEDQRSVMTNYLLVITAGLTGLVVAQKLTPATLPLAVLIILVGVYGAVISRKYHERANYHLQQARGLTQTLTELGALHEDHNIAARRQAHYAEFPRLSKIRLHLLWTGLHIAIAAFGTALAIAIIAR